MFKAWWMTVDLNFGDMLTPYILDHFNISYEHISNPQGADLLCIGSIARRAENGTVVLGSGIMGIDNEELNPSANWRFVRGRYTRDKLIECGGNCPKIYGDAALLLPLLCAESKKEHKVGIVPHFVDYDLVKEKFPDYYIIDVISSNPLGVAKKITKCKSIISSSLHGIIAAQAYGIPAAWVNFSNNIKGNGIKFYDHFSSVGIDGELSNIESPKFMLGKYDTKNIEEVFESLA